MKEILEKIKEWNKDNEGEHLDESLFYEDYRKEDLCKVIAHLSESLRLIADNSINLTAHDMSFHAKYTLDPESVA